MKLKIKKNCKWGDTGQVFAGRITTMTEEQKEQLKYWNKDKQVPEGGTKEYYEKEKLEKLLIKVNEENETVKNGFPSYFVEVEEKAINPEDINNTMMKKDFLLTK